METLNIITMHDDNKCVEFVGHEWCLCRSIAPIPMLISKLTADRIIFTETLDGPVVLCRVERVTFGQLTSFQRVPVKTHELVSIEYPM